LKDLQREILNQVAAGVITAEEGAARLEALDSEDTPLEAGGDVRQVRVISRFGTTDVIGDASVAVAVADGPHQARQEGDTMVIEQSLATDSASFEFTRPTGRSVLNGFDLGRRLTVRMNPALPLIAGVQAGNLRIEGMRGPVTSDVQAGNCRVDGFRGPLKVSVAAGNVTASGRLDSGASTVRCEMGSVKVNLEKSSSVRINAHTTMGKVAIEGAAIKDGVLGSGAGTLDIECTMGNVRVGVD
jgi:hypothetical protein